MLVSSPGANSIMSSPSASAYSPDHEYTAAFPAEFTHVAPLRTALSTDLPMPFEYGDAPSGGPSHEKLSDMFTMSTPRSIT